MNDQVVMMITLFIYSVATVAVPFVPNIVYLYVLAAVGGATIGVSNLGNPTPPNQRIIAMLSLPMD